MQFAAKSANGVTWTLMHKAASAGNVAEFKGKYKVPNVEVEGKANTNGDLNIEIKDSFAQGFAAKMTGKLLADETEKEKTLAGGELSYKQGRVATALNLDFLPSSSVLASKFSVVGGVEGIYLGAELVAEFSADAKKLVDYNIGTEFALKDYTFTVKTEKKLDLLHVLLTHKYDASRTLVGAAAFDLTDSKTTLPTASIKFGGSYAADPNTVYKMFVERNAKKESSASLSFEQKWRSDVRLGVTSNCSVTDPSKHKIGVQLSFGELTDD